MGTCVHTQKLRCLQCSLHHFINVDLLNDDDDDDSFKDSTYFIDSVFVTLSSIIVWRRGWQRDHHVRDTFFYNGQFILAEPKYMMHIYYIYIYHEAVSSQSI